MFFLKGLSLLCQQPQFSRSDAIQSAVDSLIEDDAIAQFNCFNLMYDIIIAGTIYLQQQHRTVNQDHNLNLRQLPMSNYPYFLAQNANVSYHTSYT
ncbi:MAG: hypothetical protein EZS28_012431 [Streblomastix strix]|uniref:Uncharacterized protein n=1 Tax=Streblomastix strix TaxID=222440 RepID=A0A5J4WBW0_9EUKA|nr:MAG: hypothetical protein EZS28_012431 [Streblomastix strix]